MASPSTFESLSANPHVLREVLQEKSILLIDDIPEARRILRTMLSLCDLKKIRDASNAQDAVRLLEAGKVDIVLSDYNLGDARDGQQLYEDLLERKLVDESVIYMMITGERSYERVVRAAELAPDDYILKPFTPSIIYSRLERAYLKKAKVQAIIEAMLKEEWRAAASRCDEALAKPDKRYLLEILRLKGDALFMAHDFDRAWDLFSSTYDQYRLPWAKYGMVRITRARGKLAAAAEMLEELIIEAPTFIKAQDELAALYQEMGEFEKAEQVLERANQVSPNNVKRQKKLSRVAFMTGKFELAEQVLNNIVDNCKFSVSHDPEDFALLGKVLAKQGKSQAGLTRIKEAGDRFGAANEVRVSQLASEAIVLFDTGEEEKSRKTFVSAKHMYDPGMSLPEDTLMSLAEAALRHGDEDFCNRMLAALPQGDAFDSLAQARSIARMYARAGRSDLSSGMVEARKREVMALNDEAVLAAREKKYDTALPVIRKAAQALPEDVKVIANMVKVLLAMMRDGYWNVELENEIVAGLAHLGTISPDTQTELTGFHQKLKQVIQAPAR